MASGNKGTNNSLLYTLQTNSMWMDKESLVDMCDKFYSIESVREALQDVKSYPGECSDPSGNQNKRMLLEELVSFILQTHSSKQHLLSAQCHANEPLTTVFRKEDPKKTHSASDPFSGTPVDVLKSGKNRCFLGRSVSFGSRWGKPRDSDLFTEWRKNYYMKPENKKFLKSALEK